MRDVRSWGKTGSSRPTTNMTRLTLIGHQFVQGRRHQARKVVGGPNATPLPSLGPISSRNWMGCAEHGNSGKHEQAYCLLHRDAAVERHRVFSVTPRRLPA